MLRVLLGDDGRCFDWTPRLQEFIERRASLKSLLEMKVRSVLAAAEASADNLQGSSHGRLCAASDPSPSLTRLNQSTICDLPLLIFVFTTLPASLVLKVNTQTGRFTIEQATASVPSTLVQTPVLSPGMLEGSVQHDGLASSRH